MSFIIIRGRTSRFLTRAPRLPTIRSSLWPSPIIFCTEGTTCIAGGLAQAFYGKIPRKVEEKMLAILDERLRNVVLEFKTKYLEEV